MVPKQEEDPDKKNNQHKWHSMDADDVLEKLDSSQDGLGQEAAQERLEKYGPNKLPSAQKRTALQRFLAQFNNVLIYILIIAAGVTALLGHWIDTAVILAVVLINAIVGFLQEGKAEKALEQISEMLTPHTTVLRNGKKEDVEADQLIPGDIVLLESGDKVPADLRLIEVNNLKVDESVLTGESEGVQKSVKPVDEEAVINDQENMAFSGTLVTYGRGRGVITATAIDTEIGKISEMLSEQEKLTTPLLKKIERFGRWLSVVIVVISGLLFGYAYFIGNYSLGDSLLAVISLAVAAIPEGLPAIITITLAIGVQEMAQRNAIIRRLPAVETLGAVTFICTDKTGTLTRNEMTAKTLIAPENRYRVEGTGYNPEGDFYLDDEKIPPEDHSEMMNICRTALLCNEAEIKQNEDGEWELNGDPTDGALAVIGMKAGINKKEFERLDMIPFESETKLMATLHKNKSGEKNIYIKGAPEKILELCSRERVNGETREIDQQRWKERMDETAGQGERLIAVAIKKAENDQESINMEDVENEPELLGVIGMKDAPREEAAKAVEICQNAGINIIMITGDHLLTARAIAKELGMKGAEKALTGKELEEMSDEELREVVKENRVFARTNPEHKLKLVKALQENNEVVAMTGDGVNDAPALKRADIGVAMGIKGTEVSKDSSEFVLADDNFASIESAIKQGRTIYDNIRKVVLFIMPTNGAEALVIILAIMFGMLLPLSPVQILWVNMVTAVTLALALAFEPTEQGVMQRKPRDPDEPILGAYFLWRILFVSVLIASLTLVFFFWTYQNDMTIENARTIALNMLVAGQAFYLFNCRYMNKQVLSLSGLAGNHYALIAVGVLIILQLFITYTPFMNTWFGTSPLQPFQWALVMGGGLGAFVLVELEKFIFRKIGENGD
ncbi:MAG: cation-transporting P-type ATPase [Balneolaceae bacterium]